MGGRRCEGRGYEEKEMRWRRREGRGRRGGERCLCIEGSKRLTR